MKKYVIGLLSICSIIVFALISSTFDGDISSDKKQYLVVEQLNNEKIINTYELTTVEASQIKEVANVLIVEEDQYVYGSKNDKEKQKINKQRHQKKTKVKSSKSSEDEWNIQVINATPNTTTNTIVSGPKVKVALIDSGIDYTTDIEVFMRKNFIPGEDEVSIIYEDSCGHGTSVAGIIAAKDNEDGITGINPNVELYSARVLDGDLKAPVSRVVEAIYWAIDNNVNIINISFGTLTNSNALKLAIDDAYDAGILIVAAAGNKGVIEYPAAYDEVIAVGSVDSKGEKSAGSAIGEQLELMAPGQQILSTGDFGGVSISSGTSVATPHVVGIASILWQQDLSCTNDFIRKLMDYTANQYGDKINYGYGLIDLAHALDQYDEFKAVYVQEGAIDENIEIAEDRGLLESNAEEILVFNDVNYVEGSWATDKHGELAGEKSDTGQTLTTEALAVVKIGAKASDYDNTVYPYNAKSFLANPQFHGFTSQQVNNVVIYDSNYMSSYIYLTKVALGFANSTSNSGTWTKPTRPSYLKDDDYNNIDSKINATNVIGVPWATALGTNAVTDRNKRLFCYGLALHSVTDTFAHCTYETNGTWINHPNADDGGYIPNRLVCATLMARYVVGHIKTFTEGSLSDYYNVAKTTTTGGAYDETAFLIPSYAAKAKIVDSTYYTTNKAVFDNISIK